MVRVWAERVLHGHNFCKATLRAGRKKRLGLKPKPLWKNQTSLLLGFWGNNAPNNHPIARRPIGRHSHPIVQGSSTPSALYFGGVKGFHYGFK